MSDDLRDDLEAIEGVGPATADAVLDVLEEYAANSEPDPLLQKALDAADAGDDRQAAIYLRRFLRRLE